MFTLFDKLVVRHGIVDILFGNVVAQRGIIVAQQDLVVAQQGIVVAQEGIVAALQSIVDIFLYNEDILIDIGGQF